MEIEGYNMPEDLYYEENHFWLKQEDDLVVMGLDDFGQRMAGEIVYIQLPPEGERIEKGEVFAKLESGKWLGKIYGPIDGELIEINEELELTPDLINEDPYDEGWMFKIKPDNMEDLKKLIHGSKQIEKFVKDDLEKYSEED